MPSQVQLIELTETTDGGEAVQDLQLRSAGLGEVVVPTIAAALEEDLIFLVVGLLDVDLRTVGERPDGRAVLTVLFGLDDLTLHGELVDELLVADLVLRSFDLLLRVVEVLLREFLDAGGA